MGKLIVVKVGTSSLTNDKGSLDMVVMENLVDQIASAVKSGNKIILVTSGAVASGIAELGVKPKPRDILFQQVSAATGQAILMAHYRELFKPRGVRVAQILLTQNDLSNRGSYVHIRDVLEMLLQLGVVPVINENDVTSIDELVPVMKGFRINFSDNDVLSALISNAMEADLLIILSDVDGLYTMNPQKPEAELIPVVEEITPKLKIPESKSKLGRGGIKTKLRAAEIVTSSGIPMIIANCRRENVLTEIISGKKVGTLFKARGKMPGIKRWIAFGASVKGRVKVNEGAKKAVIEGASLLPVGIEDISGIFNIGDVINLIDQSNKIFARGIANYTSEEAKLIKGTRTSQIEDILGYIRRKEVVSRKYMFILEETI